MNKDEVIKLLANYLQQAVDFSVVKAPEILQQYISLQLMKSVIAFIISGAVLLVISICLKELIKKHEDNGGEVVFLFVVFIFFLVMVAGFGYRCLAIWLYPEGWLLSQFLTKY